MTSSGSVPVLQRCRILLRQCPIFDTATTHAHTLRGFSEAPGHLEAFRKSPRSRSAALKIERLGPAGLKHDAEHGAVSTGSR